MELQETGPRAEHTDPGTQTEVSAALTLVLLGHTGVGKSASGNTLLQREAFVSRRSFRSVTTEICEQTGTVAGQQVTVVDTPGIMSAQREVRAFCQELMKRNQNVVFLFTLKIDRFTQEQEEALRSAMGAVGEEGLSRGLLLFTGADTLGPMTLEQFIYEEPDSPLVKVVQKLGDRVHMFNNTPGGPEKNQQRNQEQVLELMNKICQIHRESPVNLQRQEDVRLVLLGLPGAGKSSSGNTILGSQHFEVGCDFRHVTREVVSKRAEVGGRTVTVVDTPGFGAEGFTAEQQFEQLRDAMFECEPGPHAFVLVIRIGRISEADCKLLELVSKVFDTDLKYVTLLFTHEDKLKGRSLDPLIQTTPVLKELLQKCGGRYSLFNNDQAADLRQVQKLLHNVDLLCQGNGGHYTLDMLAEKHALALGGRDTQNTPAHKHVVPYDQKGKYTTKWVMDFFAKLWEDIKWFFKSTWDCLTGVEKKKKTVQMCRKLYKSSHTKRFDDRTNMSDLCVWISMCVFVCVEQTSCKYSV